MNPACLPGPEAGRGCHHVSLGSGPEIRSAALLRADMHKRPSSLDQMHDCVAASNHNIVSANGFLIRVHWVCSRIGQWPLVVDLVERDGSPLLCWSSSSLRGISGWYASTLDRSGSQGPGLRPISILRKSHGSGSDGPVSG